MKVLITGAAGKIGSILAEGLKDRYDIRGFDCEPIDNLGDVQQGDITDFDAVSRATRGVEAVIHMAASASARFPWEKVLPNNIVGTYNVFEAARKNGVRRIAFASRAGILSPYPETIQRTVSLPPRPINFYTISKLFGENLGYMYAHEHGLEVVCVRIGGFYTKNPKPTHPHHLTAGDAVRVFERAIVHPGVKFEIVFGVSDSSWPLYDLDHGRRVIGYEPRDRSEFGERKEQ